NLVSELKTSSAWPLAQAAARFTPAAKPRLWADSTSFTRGKRLLTAFWLPSRDALSKTMVSTPGSSTTEPIASSSSSHVLYDTISTDARGAISDIHLAP